MSGGFRGPGRGRTSILLGVLLLARGRADGILQFGDSSQAFLASLAPLIAFPLVGSILMLTEGGGLEAVADLLATLCALLAPPVLSYEPARLWHRQDRWLRFATALNWCQWAIPVMAIGLMVVVYPILAGVFSVRIAGFCVIFLLAAYALWLHWFLARHGLELSVFRAALLVVIVNVGTVVLVMAPRLVSGNALSAFPGVI